MLPIRPHARRRRNDIFRSPVTRFFPRGRRPLVARARARSPPLTSAPSRAPLSFDSSQSQVFRGASRADKGKQLELQNAILGSDDARAILEVVGESLEHFSAVNAVTALYRIARSLTSRAGRLRRKEASFVTADPRFLQLVEAVEERSAQLDRVGLENRKWAYHKLMLPSEYRARAALSVRLLDRAKDLQGELMDAVDVEQILLMVEDQCEIFNKVNVSTALHRVARLATTNMPGVAPVDAAAVMHDPRFAKLMTLVEETAEEMAVVSVSNVLWALARLHYPASPELVDILAARAARECASAEPRHLSTVMWALAVLGHEPRSRLLAAVADRAIETAEGFRAPDIVNIMWSYARWHRVAAGGAPGTAKVVDALCTVALRNLENFTPYQCANLAWSLAMLEAPLPSPRALGLILDRAAKEPASLDPTALTHTLWAVGVKGTSMDGNSGSFQTLLAEAASRATAKRVGRAGAAGVIWACGRLQVTPRPGEIDALLGRLLDGGRGGKQPLESQALVHAVWGVSQMEGVTMSEEHRAASLAHARRLVAAGRMSEPHAEALLASAAGAGLDPRAMEEALAA